MADNIATVNLLGLSEVKDYFSDKRIKKAVAIGLAKFTLEVHSVLRTAVHNRYTGNQDLDKQLIKSKQTVKFGKGVLSAGLQYKIKRQDLSKFNYTTTYGALHRGDGWVHTVEVVRGHKKVLKGKSGRGGFTPRVGGNRYTHGKAKRIFRGGAQMLERTGGKRLPLRVLYAPDTRNMINRALDKDPKVQETINNFAPKVGDLIDA